MGRYIVRVAEEYYDEEHTINGHPITRLRYTGEEYETSVEPDDSVSCSVMSDGYTEVHTVIGSLTGGRGRRSRTYEQCSYEKDVELCGEYLYKKGSNQTVLIECPYKDIEVAEIPDTVKKIGNYAFEDCYHLGTIVIPSSVEVISSFAFAACRDEKGVYRYVTLTFSNDVKTIPSGFIPDNTSRLPNDFYSHLVKNIVIPDSVTRIEDNAFKNMDLRHVTLPNSIIEIGKGVFSESKVYELNIPESLWMRYKDVMLEGCKRIWEVKSGTKLLYYNYFAPWRPLDCLKHYSEIGDDAFACADIMKAENLVGESDLNLYLWFSDGISINEASEYREKKIYMNEHIKENALLKIPDSIQSIGKRAFMGCTVLVTVELPEWLTYLGDEAFKDCINLEEITIPEWLTCVGKNVFEGCINLKRVLLSRKLYEESKWEFPETAEFLFYDD